jgi:hypothetical protein
VAVLAAPPFAGNARFSPAPAPAAPRPAHAQDFTPEEEHAIKEENKWCNDDTNN